MCFGCLQPVSKELVISQGGWISVGYSSPVSKKALTFCVSPLLSETCNQHLGGNYCESQLIERYLLSVSVRCCDGFKGNIRAIWVLKEHTRHTHRKHLGKAGWAVCCCLARCERPEEGGPGVSSQGGSWLQLNLQDCQDLTEYGTQKAMPQQSQPLPSLHPFFTSY